MYVCMCLVHLLRNMRYDHASRSRCCFTTSQPGKRLHLPETQISDAADVEIAQGGWDGDGAIMVSKDVSRIGEWCVFFMVIPI